MSIGKVPYLRVLQCPSSHSSLFIFVDKKYKKLLGIYDDWFITEDNLCLGLSKGVTCISFKGKLFNKLQVINTTKRAVTGKLKIKTNFIFQFPVDK